MTKAQLSQDWKAGGVGGFRVSPPFFDLGEQTWEQVKHGQAVK